MVFGSPRVIQLHPFWESFSRKIDEKINAKFDTPKVMNFSEKSMRK